MTTTDTDREATVAVQCTVPEYQRQEWEQHADDLDMSLSEYLRCMTQAGRNGFTAQSDDTSTASDQAENSTEIVEFDLLAFIRERGPTDWDDVMTALEADVEESLNSLQTDGVVVYSGQAGGYVVSE